MGALLYKWLAGPLREARFALERTLGVALDWQGVSDRNEMLYESAAPLARLYSPLVEVDDTFVLQEYFVPRSRLLDFVSRAKAPVLASCHVYPVHVLLATHAAAQAAAEGSCPSAAHTPGLLLPAASTQQPTGGAHSRLPCTGGVMFCGGAGGGGGTCVHVRPASGTPPDTTGASPGKAEMVRPESAGVSCTVPAAASQKVPARSTSCAGAAGVIARVACRPRAIVLKGEACVPALPSSPFTASA
jgi:hypothetical protein